MNKTINYYLFVSLLFILIGCSNAESDKLMLLQSDKGMTFHGLQKQKALEIVSLLKDVFPELENTRIVSVTFDIQEKAYSIIPEHYMALTSESTTEIQESYLVALDFSWVKHQSNGEPDVKRLTKF